MESSKENSAARRSSTVGGRRETQVGGGNRASIVQVNTSSLEVFLQGLKKQIARHETEINNPPWWDSIKSEIDKISLLARKLDHSQLDIATIRNFILDKSEKGANHATDQSNFLKGEIEAMRLLVRRIELHQAVEAATLKDVGEMKNSMKAMQNQIKEDNTTQRIDQLEAELADLSMSLRDNIDEAVEDIKDTSSKHQHRLQDITTSLAQLKTFVNDEVHAVVEDSKATIQRLVAQMNDETASKRDIIVDAQLNELKERCSKATITKTINLHLGFLKLENAAKLRRKWELTVCFRTWKKKHPTGGGRNSMYHNGAITGSNGMQFVNREVPKVNVVAKTLAEFVYGVSNKCYSSFVKESIKLCFKSWKRSTKLGFIWDRLKAKIAPGLVSWYHRIRPDIKRYFSKWKMNILLFF